MDVIITFIFYFLVFTGIHSALAADYFRSRVERRLNIKYGFYRIIYSIISIVIFAPVFLIWIEYTVSTPIVYSIPQWLYYFFLLIRLFAIGMFVYAAFQTDILECIGIKQKTEDILITGGAYGVVRHPLYTSGIILLFTKIDMSLLDLTAVMLISIYLVIGAFIKETRLLSVFGDEYRKYQRHVSMFVPLKRVTKLYTTN